MSTSTCPLPSSKGCTLATCPLSCAQVNYIPTSAGNTVYLLAFSLLLLAQLGLGVRYKTWGFMVGMVTGLTLEVVGYAGRLAMHNDPFDFGNFIMYLVPLTIGPALLTSALYLCLSRIVVVQGQYISRFSPRTYAVTFMTSDFISLVLQGAGGGIAATADDHATSDIGRGIMIAGVVSQVVSLLLFMGLWLEFVLRLRRVMDRRVTEEDKDTQFGSLRRSKRFARFQYALAIAVVLIFVRCVYRVAELQQGFNGPIANEEISFMILEGPIIILAVLVMTVWHPGFAFNGQWVDATWSLKQSRASAATVTMLSEEPKHTR